MLVSSSHRTVKLWDTGTREPIGALGGAGANAVSFSHDGIMLASGSWRGVTLWDVATRRTIATLEGHARSVNAVVLSPDRMRLVSGSDDGTILLWDISQWTRPRPSVLAIISGDGQQGEPGAELTQPLVVEVRDQYGDLLPEVTVAFTVTAGEGQLSGRFTVEHTTTDAGGRAELLLTLGLQPGPNIVGVSFGGHELATFTAQGVGTAVAELEGDYRTWHLPAAATARLGKGAMGEGDRAVTLSADGRCLAVASAIGVWLYEAATSRAQALLPSERAVHSVAFSLDGTLAAGLDNGRVELWEVETGERTGTLRHADWGRVTVVFSPDGTKLASGSLEQVIKVWDVETRRVTGTWEVPRDSDSYWDIPVAFSPDGTRLASGFQDGTVRLWEVATQTEVGTLEGHTDRVASVAFSPDGKSLVSGSWRTVRLWDLATKRGTNLQGHTGPVHSVAFTRDGATLASGASDGTMLLWNLGPHPRTLTRVPGRRQQGPAGTVLDQPFTVLVLDQYGDPLAGATVTFAVTAGDGTLSVTTAATDADGRAATTLTLGPQPGTNTVEATVDRLQPVIFTAVGRATAATLDILSGDEQQGPAGTALSEPFVVEVRDQSGAAHAGAGVIFSVTAGGGTLSASTAATDANGRAATTLTLGREPGTNTVRARVSGLQPVTFTATAEATPDFNGDGLTDFADFFLFAEAFGGSDPRFDLDASGSVDFADFFLFAESFGQPARAKLVAMARELIGLPDGPQLQQNAPNPFNSGTLITWFQLPAESGAPGGLRADRPAGGGAAGGAEEGGNTPTALGRPGRSGPTPGQRGLRVPAGDGRGRADSQAHPAAVTGRLTHCLGSDRVGALSRLYPRSRAS